MVKDMNEEIAREDLSLRALVYFPVIFNVIGILAIGLLFAVSPDHSADPGAINTVALASLFLPWWLFASIVIRRLRRKGVSIREFIMPGGRFNLMPAVLVFVLLNVLFSAYIVVSLVYGRIPAMSDLNPLQILFFIVLVPITAGFAEELIWRGYFIDKLIASGSSETRAIIYSSISFAFIHGFWFVDKLAVTFLFGLIAGFYYARERNLLVLMVAHVVVDVIGYGLTIFAFG
jgi:membrane protease YdiL (CAAX protease family)